MVAVNPEEARSGGNGGPIVSAARGGVPSLLRRLLSPTGLVGLVLIAVLFVLVANPVIRLVVSSVQSTELGTFTLENYAIAYGSMRSLQALLNSLIYGVCVTLVAIVLAVPIAWAISRTDMPGKGLIRALILGAFITPSYLGAIGWILLAGPNAGWLNQLWMNLTGSDQGILDIYSLGGLVFVTAIYAFPYVFVFVSDALDLLSSEMEDAANILGAGMWRTTFKVTLPLVVPAILAGSIITFLDTIALFGTPAIIALPARINVMTLQLWQFFEFPVRVEAAAAYSIPLVGLTCLLLGLQRFLLGRKGYVALTGKTASRRLIAAGPLRWVFFAYAMLVCALAVLLPYLALGQAAFSKAWGRGLSWENLTLGNFYYIFFQHQNVRESISNTFLYSAGAATLAVAIGLGVAYMVNRRLVPFGGLLALLCMTPFVIPGIVLAISFYSAYTAPPLSLYGTGLILVLAFTTRFLPIAYANCGASMRSINPEMEEAVRILGGSRLKALGSVIVPLLKKNLAGCWILVFIPAMRELSTAIFLIAPNTRVLSVMLLDLSEDGNFEALSALGLFLLLATILVVLVSYRMLGRDLLLRRSS
ncbi:ABC transporter permease [Rhodoligotrophos defluvii]|uniref:ABC transporter permease n=1 Tax=Rhodoligotrophos defluvii TaxID=2561934 RepID=UPI0010C9E07D|nr:iron ABC transporter permease [Rhodoligotrophos defluvii]